MRSSSIMKSTATAVSLILALTVVAPTALARNSRTAAGTPAMQQVERAASRMATSVREFVARFFAPSASGTLQPPLPVDTSLTTSETITTDTKTKTKQ